MKRIVLLIALTMMASPAYGDVINIDVGRIGNATSGSDINNITDQFDNGVVGVSDPDSDGIFTPDGNFTAGTALALVNNTGAASGISVDVWTQNIPNDEIAEAGTGGDFEDPADGSHPAFFVNQGIPGSALEDGLFLRDEQGDEFLHFVFSGLSQTDLHTFRIYGARPANALVTNIDVTEGINGNVITSGSYDPLQNSEILTFSNLSADINGEITLKVNAPGTAGSGTVNFIQLETTAVPEPTSAIVLSLVGFGLVARRRK